MREGKLNTLIGWFSDIFFVKVRRAVRQAQVGRRLALPVSGALALLPVSLPAVDWPMMGGRPDRNMVSAEAGVPIEWGPTKNVKWSAELGDVTYASPVVADGRVFIGTNNDDPNDKTKRGVLKCFSAKDGAL